MLIPIFYYQVDGSTSRRDKESIEGIKAAIYNCDAEGDYIKTAYGIDALVGDVVTVLNNRKIRRESKTIMGNFCALCLPLSFYRILTLLCGTAGAIHEIQNRLVGKDEKNKTQVIFFTALLMTVPYADFAKKGYDHPQPT